MDTRPEQPPEGRLIHDAADRLDLSIREAAKRAGISYGRWRQITTGYQNVSPGSYAAVHAPAKTLAKMARVVGVTPAQLTEAGRDDAAAVLAELLRAEPAAPAPEPPAEPGADAEVNAQVLSLLFRRKRRDHEAEVRAEIRAAKAAYRRVPLEQVPEAGTEADVITDLPGAAIPGFDAMERIIWDLGAAFTEDERAGRIAQGRAAAEADRPRARRAGLKRPDGLTALDSPQYQRLPVAAASPACDRRGGQ